MRSDRLFHLTVFSFLAFQSLSAQFSGGSGTPESPYVVATLADLDNVRNYSSSCFVQTADITVNTGFQTIHDFSGTYDGLGCAIDRLIIYDVYDEVGLFGRLHAGGTVKNVRLTNADIHGGNYVGALVGVLDGGTVLRCSSTGDVNSSSSKVGGLIGLANAGSVVSNSYSTAKVWCNISRKDDAGGFIGLNNGTIDHCFASGPVTGFYLFLNSGGFVGENFGTISDCYSSGAVYGYHIAGGFCGRSGSGSITNCLSLGFVTSDVEPNGFCGSLVGGSISHSYWMNGVSGCDTSQGGTLISDSLICAKSALQDSGWVFDPFAISWMLNPYYNNGYPCLNGVTAISSFALRAQAADRILTTSARIHGKVNPLSGSSTTVYFLYGTTYGTYTDSVLAFESPVSGYTDADVSVPLAGLTRGRTYYYAVSAENSSGYHRSTPWKFTTTSYFSGGAGTADDPYLIGTLDDLMAIDTYPFSSLPYFFKQIADIDASATASMNSGAGILPLTLMGSYDGQGFSITNLRIDYTSRVGVGLFNSVRNGQWVKNVRLVNAFVRGASHVGGLTGSNDGQIVGCSISGSVSSYRNGLIETGGLVGLNSGSIDQCYSTASVTDGGAGWVGADLGGLVGHNTGTITNSYAAGTVGDADAFDVGGFIGANSGTAANCYSTARVTAAYQSGGFSWSGGTATNCFWDTLASGCSTSGGGTGTSTAQMKLSATFTGAGWNFSTVWSINPTVNSGYPQLKIATESLLHQPVGDGTTQSPYRIASIIDLYWITQNPSSWSSHFIQTADIDASPTAAWNGGAGLLPIGNNSTYFSGSYNGQRHTISGLFINRPLQDGVGLFGYKTGRVENLGLPNVNITGGMGTAALVGISYYDVVSRCWSTGTVTSTENSTGGLIGEHAVGGVVDSYSLCTVHGGNWTGGLVGSGGAGTIVNCYAAGAVHGGSSTGGLAGSCGGAVSNSFWDIETSGQRSSSGGTGKTTVEMKTQSTYSSGGWDCIGESANGSADTWGMLGAVNNGYPCHSEQLPVTLSSNAAAARFFKAGGSQEVALTGTGAWSAASDRSWLSVSPASGTGTATLTLTADAHDADTVRTAVVTLTVSGVGYALVTASQTAVATSGTESDPHLIGTYSDLKLIGTLYPLSSVFRLTADIDASASATENSGAGFMPIGNSSAPFTGVLHGSGHSIVNLHINRPAMDSVGLFGYANADASIDSLLLKNVLLSGRSAVGGLAGACNGVISRCSVSGAVAGASRNTGGLLGYQGGYLSRVDACISSAAVSGKLNVGGLVGYGSGQITNSFSAGAVSGADGGDAVGGLIGACYGTVSSSYASGAVMGDNSVGGFAGFVSGTISNCYAAGSVYSSNASIGGFCGENYGSIGKCFASGMVSGSGFKGALVGYMGGGSIQASYWNKGFVSLACIGKRVGGACSDTLGMETAQMKKQSSYTGWNFISPWMIREDSTYPGLRTVGNNVPTASTDTLRISGSGSITSIMTNDWDIDKGKIGLFFKVLSVYCGGSIANDSVFTFADASKDSLLYRTAELLPEGDTLWSSPAKVLLINQSYAFMAGDGTELSPYLVTHYSHLKDMRSSLASVYRLASNIDASASATEKGGEGLDPIGDEATPFTGKFHGGGHTITHLHINRPMNGNIGLFGYVDSAAVIDSVGVVDASITGWGGVGALAGEADGSITHCYSTGTVTGSMYVGGLIGMGGRIDRSFSSAVVNGSMVVGGLAGYVEGRLTRSYASGSVTISDNYAGGLVGVGGAIVDCYATGNVSGDEYIGGLAGYAFDSIKTCYAAGSITGTYALGGLIGAAEAAAVDRCYWDTDHAAAGIGIDAGGTTCADTLGLTAVQMQLEASYSGWDFIATWENVASSTPRLREIPFAALPVELTSFTATLSGSGAALAWSTATEVNNYGFEIERRNFAGSANAASGQWAKIGFVKGSGTCNAPQQYAYADRLQSAGTFSYRLKQIDIDGSFAYSQTAQVTVAPPKEYGLSQNYPNPFNPTTTINYQLPVGGAVKLIVYDLLGKEVAMVVNEEQEAGRYQVQFNGSGLSSGVYFFRLSSGKYSALKKMLLMK